MPPPPATSRSDLRPFHPPPSACLPQPPASCEGLRGPPRRTMRRRIRCRSRLDLLLRTCLRFRHRLCLRLRFSLPFQPLALDLLNTRGRTLLSLRAQLSLTAASSAADRHRHECGVIINDGMSPIGRRTHASSAAFFAAASCSLAVAAVSSAAASVSYRSAAQPRSFAGRRQPRRGSLGSFRVALCGRFRRRFRRLGRLGLSLCGDEHRIRIACWHSPGTFSSRATTKRVFSFSNCLFFFATTSSFLEIATAPLQFLRVPLRTKAIEGHRNCFRLESGRKRLQ